MNFKKRVNGSWVDTPHYIHNTSTDTITTLPADIYANDTTATVGLKGNMEQSSQPSPTTPIQPSECGERTGNLFDKNTVINGKRIDANGAPFDDSSCSLSEFIEVTPNTVINQGYYFNFQNCMAEYDENKEFIKRYTGGNGVVTLNNNTHYIRVAVSTSRLDSVMVNVGSTALPYEPYGYKIPIKSGGTTTPVYLGEVESTRRIKKLVLSSSQNWQLQSINSHGIANFYITVINDFLNNSSVISNYFERQTSTIADTTTEGMLITLATNASVYIRINSQTASTSQEFKNWLDGLSEEATIWYVLAEPTTGIVNEPIRKIGDYADEVSGITIPTIAGANTLSVGTTLQPSEVTATYKGWRPVSAAHEKSANLAWTGWGQDYVTRINDSNKASMTSSVLTFSANAGYGEYDTKYLFKTDWKSSQQYTISFKYKRSSSQSNSTIFSIYYTDGSTSIFSSLINDGAWHDMSYTSTNGKTIKYIAPLYSSGSVDVDVDTFMVNEGSEALPYEPYWT